MESTYQGNAELRNTNSVPKWLAIAERRAQKLVDEFAPLTQKLTALKPRIVEIQADFKKIKGSQAILGCRYFKEFCEKMLNRKEQTVYEMLGDYRNGNKDGDQKSKPHKPGRHQNLNLANEDVERMRTGLNAAVRHFEAEAAGDETKAEEAKQEFLEIAKAEPLKSAIFGDLPDHKLLLVQLLGLVEKLAEHDPKTLLTHVRVIRKRIGLDDASFGLPQTIAPEKKTPEQVNAAQAGT
ncbi:MAG: hypothetical protein ABSC64_03350 [Candidatus Korobacteraceae bacterium]